MTKRWDAKVELLALLPMVALGIWLASPSGAWAWIAGVAAVLALAPLFRDLRWGVLAALVILLGAAGTALSLAWRVDAVENRWPQVREELIQRASERLGATLEEAVGLTRTLADDAVALQADSASEAFRLLAAAVGRSGPEAGVALLDAEGRPWAWAGRHRLPLDPSAPELRARVTPFYVVLQARRQAPGRTALAEVTLAADHAVPDPQQTIAARFTSATRAQLEFYAPGRAPFRTDVFDYCLPTPSSSYRGGRPCTPSPENPRPDTLFSVRTAPPAQGAYKLDLLARGGRAVAWLLGLAVIALVAGGDPRTRLAALVTGGALLVLTPAGRVSGIDRWFSELPYYLDALTPVTTSAGALLAAGATVAIALIALWRRPPGQRWAPAVGIALLAVAPFAAPLLARGITPPAGGASIGHWLAWNVAIAMAVWGLLLAGLWFCGRRNARRTWWPVVIASGAAAAITGGLLWQPLSGWPAWYPLLWLPGTLLLATAGASVRHLFAAAAIAGMAAAVFTWGAVTDGRVARAAADVAGLGHASDPVALAMLDQLGDDIRAQPLPGTPGELYRLWYASPLNADGYPAILVTWGPDGQLLAQLPLSQVDLPLGLLDGLGRAAAPRGEPHIDEVFRVPGMHAVLTVPFPDGSLVSVGMGPRSRLLPPSRVARFLSGPAPGSVPYDMSLSEPMPGDPHNERFSWQREGQELRGDQALDLPGGLRHVHATVELGGWPSLLVRGALLVALALALAAGLWALGEAVSGRTAVRDRIRSFRLSSYRSRLAVALTVFFVVPTVGFATWMAGRLRADALRSGDLVMRQILRDATNEVPMLDAGPNEAIARAADRVGADLLWYRNGVLSRTSSDLLDEMGLIDAYLPPAVYQSLVLDDQIEMTSDALVGGRRTRVGYRVGGGIATRTSVLATPRLVDDGLPSGRDDLGFALLLATIAGVAAAVGLAGLAARSLAQPVGALRDAAAAVGRGEQPPALAGEVPEEFVSVADAFSRMARDVRSSQAALEAAQQRMAAVLRHVATGVIGLTRTLTVSVANPRAEQLLGVSLPADGRVRDATGPAWAPVWDWIEGFLRSGSDLDGNEFNIGGRRLRIQVSILGAEAGGCVVALDDVTELAHAVRVIAWGELARQVAHEIKNPLTPVRLGIQHLQRAYRGKSKDFEETLQRTAVQILGEIDRLDGVARAFSRFGTPAADQQAGPPEPVDVSAVARETVGLYALGGESRVSFSHDGPVMGLARRDELKEVLVNLVENARNARASRVALSVDRQPDKVVLVVQDDGRGISPDDLPRIFEPHFSTNTSGTGLGLAICKRLTESWGGRIGVTSIEGRGTTVQIELNVEP